MHPHNFASALNIIQVTIYVGQGQSKSRRNINGRPNPLGSSFRLKERAISDRYYAANPTSESTGSRTASSSPNDTCISSSVASIPSELMILLFLSSAAEKLSTFHPSKLAPTYYEPRPKDSLELRSPAKSNLLQSRFVDLRCNQSTCSLSRQRRRPLIDIG